MSSETTCRGETRRRAPKGPWPESRPGWTARWTRWRAPRATRRCFPSARSAACSLFSVPAENRSGSDPEHERAPRRAVRARRARGAGLRHRGPQLRGGDRVPHGRAIEQCTTMLASFSCRTKDYNRTTGAGYSKVFDASSCLQGLNETVESFAAHPAATCGAMKEAIFPCHTADYDKQNNTGLQSFDGGRVSCRAAALQKHGGHRRARHLSAPALHEAKFSCVTRDFDADAGAGHEWSDFTPTYCPSEEDTEYIEVRDVFAVLLYPTWVHRRELRVPNRGLRRRRRWRQADVQRLDGVSARARLARRGASRTSRFPACTRRGGICSRRPPFRARPRTTTRPPARATSGRATRPRQNPTAHSNSRSITPTARAPDTPPSRTSRWKTTGPPRNVRISTSITQWRGHHVQDGGLRRGRGNRRHQDFPGRIFVRVQGM